MGAMETLLARIGATQNPGHLVAQGVNKITTPGYPADDALRGYVAGAPAFQPTIGGMLKQTGTDLASSGTGFLKSLMAGDYEAAMNSSLFPMGAMTVYHGSPHKFDAFDLSKIGTGEGAQAYGHGLYFAENPKVAGAYASQLGQADNDAIAAINKRLSAVAKERDDLVEQANGINGLARQGLLEKHMALGDEYDGLLAKRTETANKRGHLYDVDIPDDEIAKMLDWDKPLSGEDARRIESALRGRLDIRPVSDAKGNYGLTLVGPDGSGRKLDFVGLAGKSAKETETAISRAIVGIDGASVYRDLSRALGGDQAASSALREAGIPGIKYLDGGSRGAGEGSRNIVLFDDKLAKVLKRE